MIVVDTHCHASPYWYEPVESLLHQMDRNGVEKAVLIQLNGQTDNSYQAKCAREHPDRLASVVIVDVASPTAPDDLARLAEQGARGVRLRNIERSPGADPLAIWRKAAELGLPVSCGGQVADFASDEFARLVADLPDLTIVVEHLGSLDHPDGEPPPYPRRRKVFDLARFPNVLVKIHGLGEFAERAMPPRSPFPFETPLPPFLELAYQAFGADRMMWGSNFPVVSAREGYRNSLDLTRERLAGLCDAERQAIFGGTAPRVLKL